MVALLPKEEALVPEVNVLQGGEKMSGWLVDSVDEKLGPTNDGRTVEPVRPSASSLSLGAGKWMF